MQVTNYPRLNLTKLSDLVALAFIVRFFGEAPPDAGHSITAPVLNLRQGLQTVRSAGSLATVGRAYLRRRHWFCQATGRIFRAAINSGGEVRACGATTPKRSQYPFADSLADGGIAAVAFVIPTQRFRSRRLGELAERGTARDTVHGALVRTGALATGLRSRRPGCVDTSPLRCQDCASRRSCHGLATRTRKDCLSPRPRFRGGRQPEPVDGDQTTRTQSRRRDG